MPLVSIVFGLLLVGLGVWGYTTSDLEGNVKLTALIPSAFGAVLVVCGLIGLAGRMLKHAMHAAALVGVIGLVLAAGRFISKVVKDGTIDLSKPAPQATLGMIVLCLLFVVLCINSFIQARRRRLNSPASGPQP
jgi:hypothetical protein